MNPGPLFETRAYGFGYSGTAVPTVRGVNLSVRPGQRVGIVGESGSGKTTLVRSLLGLVGGWTLGGAEAFGRALIQRGGDLPAWPSLARRSVGFVSQNPETSLPAGWTVSDVWDEPMRIHRKLAETEDANRISGEALPGLLRLPSDVGSKLVETLSGGQKQRVALGRALVLNPSLIFMDEPFSALDPLVQAGIINLLKDRSLFSQAIVLVSHDLALVSYLCDFVYVMQGGAVVDSGPVPQIFRAPAHDYTRQLVASQAGGS